MEETPITGLEELEAHVERLVEAPEILLNAKLFDEVELQLTGKPCDVEDQVNVWYLTALRYQYPAVDTTIASKANAGSPHLRSRSYSSSESLHETLEASMYGIWTIFLDVSGRFSKKFS